MPREESSLQASLALQALQERASEPIDYNAMVLSFAFAAASAPNDTDQKDHLIQALETVLHPHHTPKYKAWKERFELSAAHYRRAYRDEEWNAQYQRLWLNALFDLMDEIGILPIMRI